MGFKCGILGLPNVGKSTLFNAITKSSIPAENFPFCTIEPNLGIVNVPDKRLDSINDIVNSEGDDATTPNVITNDISSYGHMQNWQQHFLNVVTETVVHTDVFISEKTIKPIAGGRPFIILGDDTIYQKLQTWGIDTFDDLFGTGYNLQWYEQRADWIREVLSNLIHPPPPDLQKLYKSLIPRLKNNQERLKEAQIQNEHMIKKVANRFSC